ncbi:MAG: ABC transporter ATP-binding protein [Oscillospiraceae bacterium]|jgi:ABC-2 type transport system ATP-binding protein|nr:ABC transporter ATP-binding protein [Oscillospiraceae bacterium]
MGSNHVVVHLDHVSMRFNMSRERVDSIKEYLIKVAKRQLFFDEFWALQDVSFDIRKGEVFGLVGLNGAGKSTLLKLVAGVLKPTAGTVLVEGEIAPLIELGAGFDPDLTARENIYMNGAVLGYNTAYMRERFQDIIDFSELKDFVDVPVKNFSSGMYARLGFAIATLVRPDVLIVDEILGVGDFRFQKKCQRRIQELMGGGTTVLMVSHTGETIKKFCSRAAWLENGRLREIGPATEVCAHYENQ